MNYSNKILIAVLAGALVFAYGAVAGIGSYQEAALVGGVASFVDVLIISSARKKYDQRNHHSNYRTGR